MKLVSYCACASGLNEQPTNLGGTQNKRVIPVYRRPRGYGGCILQQKNPVHAPLKRGGLSPPGLAMSSGRASGESFLGTVLDPSLGLSICENLQVPPGRGIYLPSFCGTVAGPAQVLSRYFPGPAGPGRKPVSNWTGGGMVS